MDQGHHHNHGGGHDGHTMVDVVSTASPHHQHMMAGDHLEHMGHGGAGASQGMHGMAMYFHLGYEQYVLFQQWSAETSTCKSS